MRTIVLCSALMFMFTMSAKFVGSGDLSPRTIGTLRAAGQNPTGDIVLWVPFRASTSRESAQITRNARYVSIKLQSVYAYYKSGFLENIKHLIVKSDMTLE